MLIIIIIVGLIINLAINNTFNLQLAVILYDHYVYLGILLFIYLFKFIYFILFIFGCIGSSLLCAGFL